VFSAADSHHTAEAGFVPSMQHHAWQVSGFLLFFFFWKLVSSRRVVNVAPELTFYKCLSCSDLTLNEVCNLIF
jgi:hypothetical protein